MSGHRKAAGVGKPQAASKSFSHSHFSAIQQFRDAMARRGIVPPANLLTDGALHRCDAEGRGGKGDAAYLLHMDGTPAGGFENWRDGLGWENWRADMGRTLTPAEEAAHRAKILEAKRQRDAEQVQRHEVAATSAASIWRTSKPALANHPYLVRKHTKPHGLRVRKYGPLIVPIYSIDGGLTNLQFISADGTKRFLTGGQKRGCFSVIGKFDPGCKVLICEGWATGASIHEDTGEFVVVALDAGNLTPVALAWRGKAPTSEIVLMGDNDLSGVGQKAARAAALAVGGKYLIPPVAGHDFNDEINAGVAP